MMPAGLLARLRAVVGPAHVLVDEELTAGFERDWTGRFVGRSLAVVRPGTPSEVAAVIQICADTGTPVVPQGGNTGLVGGGVPRSNELLLSLRRLDRIDELDQGGRTVIAQAGVTLAALQARCAIEGLELGVDLASRASATIGGMIATNAGGIHVVRYGPMRRQIVGVEAVSAAGDVLGRLPASSRDSSGYDLASLLAGSEGTLAVVTRAQLRLVEVPAYVSVALLGFDSFGSAVDGAARVLRSIPSVRAVEGFFPEGVELVCRHSGLPRPFSNEVGAYLLVECGTAQDLLPELASTCAQLPGLLDSAAAGETRARAGLWAYRERHTEAINAAGVPHKLDVAVPWHQLATLPARVKEVLAPFHGVRAIMFGHVGDGNLHINLLGADPDDGRPDAAIFALVAGIGGSISAEHGIGVAKAPYLSLVRSEADLAWMRAVKSAFDSQGLLNPGVILEA